jgi:ZIP family zinc transporter
MILHSFIDGLGIGFGFQSSVYIGLSVAIAVLAHNFSDGVNIISTLLHENFQKNAKKIKISMQNKILFILNIFAPLLGIIASSLLTVSENFLLIYLSFFAGSILYLALSDILPQAHSDKHNKTPVFATLSAVLFIFLITYIGH